MVEFIANTSPLQDLHLLGQLELLPALADRVLVPPGVSQELTVGRSLGLDLPSPPQYAFTEHDLAWLARTIPNVSSEETATPRSCTPGVP